MNEQEFPIIRLCRFDDMNGCLAEVFFPQTREYMQRLHVRPADNRQVIVQKPDQEQLKLLPAGLNWQSIEQQIINEYQRVAVFTEQQAYEESFMSFQPEAQSVPQSLCRPVIRLSKKQYLKEGFADLSLPEENIVLRNIHLTVTKDGQVYFNIPLEVRNSWNAGITLQDFKRFATECTNTYLKNGSAEANYGGVVCTFRPLRTVTQMEADIALPGKRDIIRSIRVKVLENGYMEINPPKSLPAPGNAAYPWMMIKQMIERAVRKALSTYTETPASAETTIIGPKAATTALPISDYVQPASAVSAALMVQPKHSSSKPNKPLDPSRNTLGRVLNAQHTAFGFVPHSVLRNVESLGNAANTQQKDVKRSKDYVTIARIVDALERGVNGGGLGPFEIMVASWVERMRYMTKSMLLDLFQGTYITQGWREVINADKVIDIMNRMAEYHLIAQSYFVCVDENGMVSNDGHSIERIYTLDRYGFTLLKELRRNTHYQVNAFLTYQDGNTVKRYLAANQWLIYWLVTFPEAIGTNFDCEQNVLCRGTAFSGARVFASVTCNDCTMIAEPLRRIDDFELATNTAWLRDKFLRFVEMFDHSDELYTEQRSKEYPFRPVLVYICEDDAHIREVWHTLSDLIKLAPQQEIWFTNDLRIYNANMAGQRFIRFIGEEWEYVDLGKHVGVEEINASTYKKTTDITLVENDNATGIGNTSEQE